MKEKRTLICRTIELLSIIILYYIVGNKSIFLYVLSLSLYNIFIACFDHISIKERFKQIKTTKTKQKLFKYLLIIVTVISFLFMLLSILVSDLINIYLNINNTLQIFIIMGISIITRPVIKLISEYLENTTNNSNYSYLIDVYDITDKILMLVIALLVFRGFKGSTVSLLYLSKIFAFMIIIYLLYFTRNVRKYYDYVPLEDKINYRKEIKYILKNNSIQSIIKAVKNSYYYISIIVLYLILNTRYHYQPSEIESAISFTYFYALGIVNYIVYLITNITDKLPKDMSTIDKLYHGLKMVITIMIVLCIITPLTCKLVFLDPSKSIYVVMINFLGVILLLYDMVYRFIKNKKVIYISLIIGLIMKIILIIPLINAFYRTGYNLLYGDVLSTILAMLISVIIGYIHLRSKEDSNQKYFEKVLNILYDNIILAIILIVIEFVIPMDTSDYLRTLGIMMVYIIISVIFIALKNKKRG